MSLRRVHRLLIANRGEIAARIARTARAMDVVPLGVFSEADAGGAYLAAMDDALPIGPAEAARSYLDAGRVLDAARRLGADAVHPGYGFLSERASFAAACVAAGLVFVGPSAEAIAAVGDKAEAKRRARAAGVALVEGYDGDDESRERLHAEAARIGTPLLVKATAGGGGRGLRVVEDLAELDDAVASARREARAAFGDDRVLLERFVRTPRHVEIQVLADDAGTIWTIGERDCSIQRRHQKVIEEAPAPHLTDATRAALHADARKIAREVGYTNAGTAEFLVDPEGRHYFLEMNARLQVEHPVTELAYGVDLVRLQLEVASGARLDPTREFAPRAWAIEARIVAEDAAEGDRPATGVVTAFGWPTDAEVRMDSGVAVGSVVGVDYDSLLAKLIVRGDDRAEATRRFAAALDATHLAGVVTNLPRLRAIARDATFVEGGVTTAFLVDRAASLDDAVASAPDRTDDAFLLAIARLACDPASFRIAGIGIPIALASDARTVRTVVDRVGDDRLRVTGDLTETLHVTTSDARRAAIALDRADGSRIAGTVARDGDALVVTLAATGRSVRLRHAPPPRRRSAADRGNVSTGTIVAPMPGTVVSVSVREGDEVAERAPLVVLEAMKMEHRIVARAAGRVLRVDVAPGAVVAAGASLVEIG